MKKIERDIRRMLDQEGVSNADTVRGGSHFKVMFRTPDGRPHMVVAPVTPSDKRWELNFRGDVRRALRQLPEHTHA